MTNPQCPVTRTTGQCGTRLAPGAVICPGCAENLRLDLREIPGLLYQLDLTISGQTSVTRVGTGSGCPEGCTHGPDDPQCVAGVRLDLDERASAASATIRLVLNGWARVWDEQHPTNPDQPEDRRARDRIMSSTEGHASLLAHTIHTETWTPDLASELRAAVTAAWAAVDRPPEHRVAGRCPHCGTPVYARDGAARVRCTRCREAMYLTDLRDASLCASTDRLPKPDIAVLLQVPVGTLHRWSSEGRITTCGTNRAGQPLYVLGPIARHVLAGATPPVQHSACGVG